MVFDFAKCSYATLFKCNALFSADFQISNGNGKKADTDTKIFLKRKLQIIS